MRSDRDIKEHPSYEQVMLDVNRCAGRLEHIKRCYSHRKDDDHDPPASLTSDSDECDDADVDGSTNGDVGPFSDHDSTEKKDDDQNDTGEEKSCRVMTLRHQRKLKKQLAKLIVSLLIEKKNLHYYQGFHDVCLTYMTIYGDQVAFEKLDKLIDSHFSTFMQPTMNETQEFLELIPMIIGLQRPKVQEFLEEAEVGVIFALSWVITWFSHVIPNERDVEKIFNCMDQSDDPHLILYLCAAIVLNKEEKLLKLDPEMSAVHHFLCQVPRKDELPIENLLKDACKAFERWPPELVKKKLDTYRRAKLQVYNYNALASLAHRLFPTLTGVVVSNSRTAIIVLVVASALALQFDRWVR